MGNVLPGSVPQNYEARLERAAIGINHARLCRRVRQALARNVFAIYVFHFPIVLLLQSALIDAPIPKLMRLFVTVIGAMAPLLSPR